MALSGNLRDFNLPDVFQLVSFSRKTGVLNIVRDDGAQGSIYFRDGEVFFATSNWNRDPIGIRLVKARQISQKQLEEALATQMAAPEPQPRLGQVLVDEGFISDKTLETFVQEQVQDTIFDLMRWDEGEFDFKPVDLPSEEDIGLTVSIENIIMEGARRLEEWTRIKKKIPSLDLIFKMATAPGEGTFEISLKPSEWRLITLIDGTRDIERLAVDLGFNDFDVCRILYGMYSAGLLETVSGEELEKVRAEQARKKAQATSAAAAAQLKKQAEEMQPEAPVIQLVRPEEEPAGAGAAPQPAGEAAPDIELDELLRTIPSATEHPPAETEKSVVPPEFGVLQPEPETAEAAVEEGLPAAGVLQPEPETAEAAVEEVLPAAPEAVVQEPVAVEPQAPQVEAAPAPQPEADVLVSGPRGEPVERNLSDVLAEVDDRGADSGLGMASELSALTGSPVGRQSARQESQPEPASESASGLHLDHAITKETVQQIIDGLKSL
jgi:hypothetical protein